VILQRDLEEPASSLQVAALGDEHVDDLAELVDRPIDVAPGAAHLHVGLVHEPAVPDRVAARSGGVEEQRREALHRPVDRDVVDIDTSLGEQLLDVPVGEPVAQVPAHREPDHVRREPEPGGWTATSFQPNGARTINTRVVAGSKVVEGAPKTERASAPSPSIPRPRPRSGTSDGSAWRGSACAKRGWNPDGLVAAHPDGLDIYPQTITPWFNRHRSAAELPPIRLHDLRHPYATAALQAARVPS
jgi:hypothetical protein